MMKDSPSQAVADLGEPSPEEETMDLSWKEEAAKVKEEEEKEEEEISRQTGPEEMEGERPESGSTVEAEENLVKKEVEERNGDDGQAEEEEEERNGDDGQAEEEVEERNGDDGQAEEEVEESNGDDGQAEEEVEESNGDDGQAEEEEEERVSNDGEEDCMEREEEEEERADSMVEYGEEDLMYVDDTQDSPINYAKYDSPTPVDTPGGGGGGGGHDDGWSGSPGAVASEGQQQQLVSKLSCDVCGLACVSLNVLLVHKRSHTGERPFHCQQCGASFTQKGNLLRHAKLHTGEKPFKCPMCSYACRRRDALSGHLRTHSVEKPYKCNHCGRSYKQRSSLEEHRDRCHVYMQTRNNTERGVEEVSSNGGGRPRPGVERAILLDKLASNVAKRKSTMPQKFVGDAPVCLDLCFKREPGVIQSGSDLQPSSSSSSTTNPDGHQGNPHLSSDVDQNTPIHLRSFLSPTNSSSGGGGGGGGGGGSGTPLSLTNGDRSTPGGSLHHHHHAPPPPPPPGHLSLNSPHHSHHHHHLDGGARRGRHTNDGHRGSLLQPHHQQEQQQQQQQIPFNLAHLLVPGHGAATNGLPPFPLPHHHSMLPPSHPHPAPMPPPQELLRVVAQTGGKGGEAVVGTYMCGHCRVLFLDYVMFTIHMGCHGFRDPLECNVCGHLSRDRYEFSSHIARGEHFLEIK